MRISVSPAAIFSVTFTPRDLLLHAILYPTAGPPVLTGSFHDSVTLREKNVVLVQLIGGAIGTVRLIMIYGITFNSLTIGFSSSCSSSRWSSSNDCTSSDTSIVTLIRTETTDDSLQLFLFRFLNINGNIS